MNGATVVIKEFPKCPQCDGGVILPVFDCYKEQGVVYIRGWVCFKCGENILFTSGNLERREVPDGAKLEQ